MCPQIKNIRQSVELLLYGVVSDSVTESDFTLSLSLVTLSSSSLLSHSFTLLSQTEALADSNLINCKWQTKIRN